MKGKEKKENRFTNTSQIKGNQPSLGFNINRNVIQHRTATIQYWLKEVSL
jgi:hypothetical protein